MAEPKETKAKQPDLDSMTLEDKVTWFYQHGRGSIQDIARVYHISVDEVLHIIGQDEVTSVSIIGDQVDASEAGPGVQLNPGTQQRQSYTTD